MDQESNPIVELFRSAIGKKMEGAPPFSAWLDGRIVSAEVGAVEVSLKVRPEMGNPIGLMHGGVQAALIDDLIGMAAFTLNRSQFLLTIDLHVNFLGKVKVGQTVVGRTRIVRSGRNVSHAVCEILDESGRVVSRGDSNLIAVDPSSDQAQGSGQD